MAQDRFTKTLWISLGVIVASIVIAVIALDFFSGDLTARANTIVADRAMVQQQNDAVAELAGLEEQASHATTYQAAMDQLLPDQDNVFNFAQWFSQLGQQYGVTANASLQGTITPSSGSTPGTASFSFDTEGSLSDITAFLDAGAKSSTFLITFTSFDVTSNGGSYKVTGQGTIFSQ